MKYSIYTMLTLLLMIGEVEAQTPVPALPQAGPIALMGGTAHIGNGQVIQNSVITFDKGKLMLVTDATTVRLDLSGYEVINISGKHVYPGFILANSQVGIREVNAIRAMDDATEEGDMNPNVRSLISYNTDSEFIPTYRFNGVLLAESAPTGGTISGTSSVMEMEGWNWEDAVHTADVGIHLNWPSTIRRQINYSTFSYDETPNKDYDMQVTAVESFLTDAAAFYALPAKESNLKLAAMEGLFDGTKTLFIHATYPKEIVASIRDAQRVGIKRITLLAGEGAYWVASFLKENKIPVILPTTQSLPTRTDDDIDLPYKLPYLLSKAGVTVCIAAEGMMHKGRNLGFHAGVAAAYGMDKEEALKTITSNVAKALGIENRVGTLESGKDATLFVSEGDALDYRTNILSHAFISGKHVTLPGHQEELYERYSRKYGQIK